MQSPLCTILIFEWQTVYTYRSWFLIPRLVLSYAARNFETNEELHNYDAICSMR
jgi:hypothetical protein